MAELQRILYVDDDPDLLELVHLSLSTIGGIQVATCHSGESAVVATESFRPQLVLLDLNMPGLDGPSTARRIRAVDGFEQIPVVFITAEISAAETDRLFQCGMIGFLRKPLDPMTLPAQVQGIWENRGL